MQHKDDEQFLVTPDPSVPWKDVRAAVFDVRQIAQRTEVRTGRDAYLDTYDVSFRVSGELVRLLAHHDSVRHHLVEVWLDQLRGGLHELAGREARS